MKDNRNLSYDYGERSKLKNHEENMNIIIDKSQEFIEKIEKMSKEISSDLQTQNKILNDLGEKMSKTNSHLKKNTSKINDLLNKTSNCTLIMLATIQIIAIIFLILL